MTDTWWEPLPREVAEWMGLDEAMVEVVRGLAGSDSVAPAGRLPEPSRTAPASRGAWLRGARTRAS